MGLLVALAASLAVFRLVVLKDGRSTTSRKCRSWSIVPEWQYAGTHQRAAVGTAAEVDGIPEVLDVDMP